MYVCRGNTSYKEPSRVFQIVPMITTGILVPEFVKIVIQNVKSVVLLRIPRVRSVTQEAI